MSPTQPWINWCHGDGTHGLFGFSTYTGEEGGCHSFQTAWPGSEWKNSSPKENQDPTSGGEMDAEFTETSHKHSLLTQLVGPVLDSALTLESGRHHRKSPSLGAFPSCTMSSVASPLISCPPRPSWSSILLHQRNTQGGMTRSCLKNVHKFLPNFLSGQFTNKYPWNRFGTWDMGGGQKEGGK